MKRELVKLGDPIEPYLEKYKNDIAIMEADLKNELAIAKSSDILTIVDDLFLLRFRLSAIDVNEAKENCKACINWRLQNKDKLAKTITDNEPPHHHVVMRFLVMGWTGSMSDGHPIYCVRAGYSDTKGLMASLSIEEAAEFSILNNEIGFQKLDKIQREKKIMVKVINIIDLSAFSFFSDRTDLRFYKATGMASHWSEQYYPQLHGKSILVNAPSTLKLILGIVLKFQNARAVEKLAVCPVQNSYTKLATDCPFLTKHKCVDQVPGFVGGTYPTPLQLQLVSDRPDATRSIKIGSFRKEVVDLTITKPSMRVYYEFLCEEKSILFDISLNNDTKLIESQKLDANTGLLAAFVECPTSGTLKVTFDNSGGWTSRKVQYMFHIMEEEDEIVRL